MIFSLFLHHNVNNEKLTNMVRICMWLFFFGGGCLLAQDIGRQPPIDSSAVRYLRMADKQSVLYYGNEQEWPPRATNHPYLKDELYSKARLSYHQVIYPEALLRLDLSKDELITISPGFHNIVLFPENVDFAELHGQHIIYLRRDSLPGCPSTGYYILLHSGNSKVLKKNTATLMNESDANRMRYYYTFTTRYYLYKDGVYYNIRNQRGLLKALSPYKKELKRFISSNALYFKKNSDVFLTRTVNEYEKISGSL